MSSSSTVQVLFSFWLSLSAACVSAYQASLPSTLQATRPRWHLSSSTYNHVLSLRTARNSNYYGRSNREDEDDDDYWSQKSPPPPPSPQQQQQQSSSGTERPIGYADPDRNQRIASNPNMDFRSMEQEYSNDPIQRYQRSPGGPVERYYDDDDDDEDDNEEEYYVDEYCDDEDGDDDGDDDDDEDDTTGNFWSNPLGRYDPVQSPKTTTTAKPKRRVPRPDEPAPARRRPRPAAKTNSRPRRKTTLRSGTPPPPPVIGDLYNQLFWYGFDPEDTTSPADKTMFGGTKGKFNGLAFLDDALVPKPKDPAPRRTSSRPSSRRRDNYYYEDDDDDIDDYKEERTFSDTLEQLSRQQSNLNPNVPTRARNDQDRDDNDDDVYKEEPPRKRRRQRQSPWEEEEDDNQVNVDGRRKRRKINYSEDDNNWVSSKVANWFRDDVDGEDDEYAMESTTTRSHGRRGRKQQQFWAAPFDLLESFLVQENRDMSYEAEMYNRQMGLGSQRNDRETIGPSGKPRRQRRGSGYAYRYDVDTLEYDNVVDADIIADDETEKSEKSSQGSAQDMKTRSVQNESNASSDTTKTVNKADKTDEGSTSSPTNKKSWEERALAMEQIPPPGIPAWGPSGDLGMDARMKATIDALHDIQEAQNKLEQRKKREQEAMDDITILKVDVGVKKRRMAANKLEAQRLREDIRDLELEVENASRSLRKARDQVQFAQKRLNDLENRHWALLQLYNPSQAEKEVEKALREFEALEPAARIRSRTDAVDKSNGRDTTSS